MSAATKAREEIVQIRDSAATNAWSAVLQGKGKHLSRINGNIKIFKQMAK